MPMRSELPKVVARPYDYEAVRYQSPQGVEGTAYRDMQSIVAFCAIGLLVTVNMVLWFPDLGEMMSALEIFP